MMSDKKNTNLNTKTSKSSSKNALLGGTGCLWWLFATLLLVLTSTFCGAELTIGLFIGASIPGFLLGAFLAGLFGDKHAKFDVKPKHADVIEYFNKQSEVKNPLTEQQFRLIKTEMYKKLFNKNFEDSHNSAADVKATLECYFELQCRGLFKQNSGNF